MIYVQTDDKSHCLFKGSMIDLIPAEKLDLKEVSRITSEWGKSKEVKNNNTYKCNMECLFLGTPCFYFEKNVEKKNSHITFVIRLFPLL
ncbi:hypothetical protein BK789_28485 [Bacillus thuringiensis serovar darmstadiensis]|nr:hypothetical protein BK789_28485 [Bacillus thuringiensis serovar darmstadiensis]